MARTTLDLEDEAVAAAKTYAAQHRVTLGQAVSELVKLGADRPLVTHERNGFQVVQLPKGGPKVTAALVDRLAEEFP